MDKKQIAKAHAQLKPFIEEGIQVANEQPVVHAPAKPPASEATVRA